MEYSGAAHFAGGGASSKESVQELRSDSRFSKHWTQDHAPERPAGGSHSENSADDRGCHRPTAGRGRHLAFRDSLPAALRSRARWNSDSRSANAKNHRCQSVHVRTIGLSAQGVAGEGTVANRPAQRRSGEPGGLPRVAKETFYPLRKLAAPEQDRPAP